MVRKFLPLGAALAVLLAAPAMAQEGRPPGPAFGDMDANADGVVTRAEFDAANAQRFQHMDRNANGVLDADERPQPPGGGERPPGQGPGAGAGPGGFNPDANGDGEVTRAEATTAAAAMFDRLDQNRDGRLSEAELTAGRPPRP